MKRLIALLFLVVSALVAQTPIGYPNSYQDTWEVGLTTLPSTSTVVFSNTVHLDALYLANRTGSAVTVTITDGSTNCTGSTACQLFPAVSVAANQTYIADLKGVVANGGVKWSASSANAIDGWMKGKQ